MDVLGGKKKSDDSMIQLGDDEPGQLFLVLQWYEFYDVRVKIAFSFSLSHTHTHKHKHIGAKEAT